MSHIPMISPQKTLGFSACAQLASGTASDLGLWSPEQKSVSKRKARETLRSALVVGGTDFKGKNARVPMGKS